MSNYIDSHSFLVRFVKMNEKKVGHHQKIQNNRTITELIPVQIFCTGLKRPYNPLTNAVIIWIQRLCGTTTTTWFAPP